MCRLVAHDYIIVGPDFYEGMRGFGRDWQSVQPGSWISNTGENLSVEPCPRGFIPSLVNTCPLIQCRSILPQSHHAELRMLADPNPGADM